MSVPIPEWVHVWAWARRNGAKRPFPQQERHLTPHDRTDMLEVSEYETLEALWRKAGSPRSKNPIAEVSARAPVGIQDALRGS